MPIDPQHLLSLPSRVTRHRYAERDCMLYALGVGAGRRSDARDLRFVYEDGLQALPTMAVVLGYPGFWQKEPQYGIDWRRVLHAEQSCTFHAPLPVSDEVISEMSIDAIVDKGAGRGCLLRATRRIRRASNDALLATVRQMSFLRGDGGCGSFGEALMAPHRLPERPADEVLTEEVRPEQALVYRLSGDYNPLHADPAVAAVANFPAPILHGLCTYAIAGRAVLAWACENDPMAMRGLHCRFTAPVLPGDVLQVDLWRDAEDAVAFRVRVPQRDRVVLDGGRADILGRSAVS